MRLTLGEVSFELREPFDLSFLEEYGEIFEVFDQQDSGNICFALRKGEEKRFVKLAGAATIRGSVTPEEAVRRMRACSAVWRDLDHPALLRLIEDKPVPGGYMQVFEYGEGRCMSPMYGDHERFRALPFQEKLGIYETVLRFHEHVSGRGYVAIDFYDGCILYDFESRQTRLCDVEFYRRAPVVNDMGRMWGSSRFMSPEEHILGAVIDERSNVFTMGQTAFQLFGGGMDHALEKWNAPEALHAVALKAVSERREDRYATIAAYRAAWEEGCRP